MSERASLLEIVRLPAAAGLIDGKVFVRDDDRDGVQGHVHAVVMTDGTGRRHLVGV